MGCLMFILGLFVFLGAEFLLTVGIIYLITLCFGWAFSWKIAIGIWLVMTLMTSVFGGKK